MNNQQSRNVVAVLQRDPLYYRNFGVWWWHIKSELRRNGFDSAQLSGLGSFTDPSVVPIYAGMTRAELDNKAFSHQWDHTFHKMNSNASFAPDGEVYQVQDQDVE
jgi:hypothetical protein